ncbi:G5 domain-containing protein, partial [Streptococcus pasteurianus]
PAPEDQKTEPIPYEVERIEDSTLEKGKTIVKQEGEDGLRDSKGVVIRQPKNKIILVGTKEAEKPNPTNPEPTKPNPDPTLD